MTSSRRTDSCGACDFYPGRNSYPAGIERNSEAWSLFIFEFRGGASLRNPPQVTHKPTRCQILSQKRHKETKLKFLPGDAFPAFTSHSRLNTLVASTCTSTDAVKHAQSCKSQHVIDPSSERCAPVEGDQTSFLETRLQLSLRNHV